MICEHGNIAPCVECDIEPLKAENESLQKDISVLVEALEELVELMEDIRRGVYIPDSFTTQPARIALAALKS